MKSIRSVILAAGVVLGFVFLFLALRGADLDEVTHIVIEHVSWQMILLFFVPYFLFFWLKSVRWSLLLRPHRQVDSATLLPITVVGYAANVLFPMQLGEVVRAYLAGRRLESDAAPLLTSIALERVFDLLAVIVCVGFAVPVLEELSGTVRAATNAMSIVAGLGLIVLGLYVWRTNSVLAWADRLLRPAPPRMRSWTVEQLEKGATGLHALRKAHLLGGVGALSLCMWAVMTVSCLVALRTVQIEAGLAMAVVTLFLSIVGLALPTSPGFIGTIQIAFVLALTPFGIGRDQAIAASIYYNALITIPPLLVAAGVILSGSLRR